MSPAALPHSHFYPVVLVADTSQDSAPENTAWRLYGVMSTAVTQLSNCDFLGRWLEAMYSRNFLRLGHWPCEHACVGNPVFIGNSGSASKILLGFDVLSAHYKGPSTSATAQTSRGWPSGTQSCRRMRRWG